MKRRLPASGTGRPAEAGEGGQANLPQVPLLELRQPAHRLGGDVALWRAAGMDAHRREGAPVMEDPEEEARLCPDCDGTGVVRPPEDQLPGPMEPPDVPCPTCGGMGRIPAGPLDAAC